MSAATQLMAELFRGRTDAYGTNEGGCERVVPPTGATTSGLNREYQRRIAAHLVGAAPMGVYPQTSDGMVRWGCTDLDGGDADWPKAIGIATALRQLGANAHVERSRSKGFHVWTFATEPMPAETMRNALLGIHQALGVPAKEVNPKQVITDTTTLGNYVRLPYPGATIQEPERQVMVTDTGDPMPFRPWVFKAHAERTTPDVYADIARRLYKPPPPTAPVVVANTVPLDSSITTKLSRQGYLAWKHGPLEGNDRSNSLMRLAYICHEDGLSASETLAVIRDMDNRVPHMRKFTDREDGEEQLLRMVERAHSRPRPQTATP